MRVVRPEGEAAVTRWRRSAGWWLGLLGLVACVVLVLVPLWQSGDGLSTAADIAQLVTIGLSIPALLVALVVWRRRTRAPLTSARIADIKDVLAIAVTKQWETEAALRSRHRTPMRIHWRATTRSDVQAHPDTITSRPLLLLDAASHDLDSFVTDFRSLKAQRVVFLGGPGTGKTTLAVQFLLKLMAARTPEDPVPVLLSAASWDTRAHPTLWSWLAERLPFEYPALRSPDLGVDALHGHVLPILDGLDELPSAAQTAMIAALNSSPGPLVLTCRTAEFVDAIQGARQLLTSALVMEPEPMTGDEIADYLERCRPPAAHSGWDKVLASLRSEHSPLSEVAANALGLWLVTEIYLQPRTTPDGTAIPFPDPRPLISRKRFGDNTKLMDNLLDDFVPAIVASRPPSEDGKDPLRPRKRYDPAKVERWLGYLAELTGRRRDSRDFAWWRLARDTGIWPPVLPFLLLPAVALGAVLGRVLLEQNHELRLLDIGNAAVFVVIALASGHMVKGNVKAWPGQLPAAARWSGRKLVRRVSGPSLIVLLACVCVLFGLVPLLLGLRSLITGQPWSVEWEKVFKEWPVLAFCAWGFAALQLLTLVARQLPGDAALNPLQSWRNDRALQFVRVGLGVVICALAPGLLLLALTDAAVSITITLGALAFGAAIGIHIGDHHAWNAYVIAIRRLSRAGLLPRDLMYFLDDCHRLGLLRAVGPLYQFRHAALQDRLAEKYRAA